MKKFAHHIIRIKLFIGLLWLMLRGNSANAQQLYNPFTYCYRTYVKDKFISQIDMSLGGSVSNDNNTDLALHGAVGRNYLYITGGAAFSYYQSEQAFLAGPYLRIFSPDISLKLVTIDNLLKSEESKNKMCFFVEGKYDFALNQHFSNSGFSVSGGLIFFNRDGKKISPFGFEIFESFSNVTCNPRQYYFSTGLRIHYYLRK